jgi:hypothetical protein
LDVDIAVPPNHIEVLDAVEAGSGPDADVTGGCAGC